ncbi:MAG: DUF3592 domain-containing protein [Planctomycetota bacterium]|nr:DUF3592 domain-containing protein [Planctomycetota bacterium]
MTDLEKTATSGFNGGTAVALLLVIMSLPLAGLGVYSSRRSEEMQSWKEGKALVSSASVSKIRDSKSGMSENFSFYTIEYEAEGKSHKFSFREGGTLRWQKGAEVEIFYDPNDPAKASLERETMTVAYIMYGLCFLLLLISLPFWWLSWTWWSGEGEAAEALKES